MGGRQMLRNSLRQVASHNVRVEVNSAWTQRERESQPQRQRASKRKRSPPSTRDVARLRKRRALEKDVRETFEPDRWNSKGFYEMYPDQERPTEQLKRELEF